MKFIAVASILSCAAAFHGAAPFAHRTRGSPLFESAIDEASSAASVDVSTALAKSELLETAQSLNEEHGCLLLDSSAQDKLRDAVEKLEMCSDPPVDTSGLIGDWSLLCSTASATLEGGPLDKIDGIDTSKLPFFNEGPLKEIRDTFNKSLKVQQVIKTESSDGIDRIDHVLQYRPPNTLSAFLKNIPDAIKSLNINPLQVSESKVVLVHKAEIESTRPVISIKLSLQGIVVNIAGKSQILDPEGADVLGINVPFGEFLNSGSFETTYMDGKIRVSRSKVGIVDQLRVFTRSDLDKTPADAAETNDDIIIYDEADNEDDISPSDY